MVGSLAVTFMAAEYVPSTGGVMLYLIQPSALVVLNAPSDSLNPLFAST